MKKIEIGCCGECPFLEHLATGRGDIARCAHQGREVNQPLSEIASFCKLADAEQKEQEEDNDMMSPPPSEIMSLQALFDQVDFIGKMRDGIFGLSNEEEQPDEFNPVYRGNIPGNVATIEIILNNLPPSPVRGVRDTGFGTHRGDDKHLREDENQEDF